MHSNVNQQKRSIDYGDQQQWGSPSGDSFPSNDGSDRKRKRRSRWGKEDIQDKTVIPGMPTAIPANLSKEQEQQYLLHLQIEEKSRRLRTGDLAIPVNPEDRSPSPEPIYNNEGKRLNTREYRTRKKLEEDRHRLVQEAVAQNGDYKPPADYRPPTIRVNDKVMIPQDEHPDINFVGLLIGPRGNTLKNLEKETGAKIIIRGKGSVKDGKIGRKDGHPLPGEDEPLHAYVTANNLEFIKKAVAKIKSIIKESVEVPEGQNDLRKQQLRELALLNGTLRENDGLSKLRQLAQAQTIVTNTIICQNCGGAGHLGKDCKHARPGDTFRTTQQQESSSDKAKMDSEYLSLMAELGQGPPPPKQTNNLLPQRPQFQQQQQQHLQQQRQQQSCFTQPPPNPMGGFNNFQRFAPPSLLSMNNARPPMNTMQNNQMYHQKIEHSGYHGIQSQSQMHPQQCVVPQFQPHGSVPQPVAPPVSMSSQYPQSMQQMSAPVSVATVQPPNSFIAPIPLPSWTNTVTMSQGNTVQTPSMTLGGLPPTASMRTAPPPLSSSQLHSGPHMSWLQQGSVPPPPPTQSSWQQTVQPPPPPVSMAVPWQQVPSLSMPKAVVPPPPPPTTVQAFNMTPLPPRGYDYNQMSGVKQLLAAPPPPPPN